MRLHLPNFCGIHSSMQLQISNLVNYLIFVAADLEFFRINFAQVFFGGGGGRGFRVVPPPSSCQ